MLLFSFWILQTGSIQKQFDSFKIQTDKWNMTKIQLNLFFNLLLKPTAKK